MWQKNHLSSQLIHRCCLRWSFLYGFLPLLPNRRLPCSLSLFFSLSIYSTSNTQLSLDLSYCFFLNPYHFTRIISRHNLNQWKLRRICIAHVLLFKVFAWLGPGTGIERRCTNVRLGTPDRSQCSWGHCRCRRQGAHAEVPTFPCTATLSFRLEFW